MSVMTTKILFKSLAILICISVLSCKSHAEAEYHTLNEKIMAESLPEGTTSQITTTQNDDILKVEVTEQWRRFFIADRKSQLKAFNCSECHMKPLAMIQTDTYGKKAHWDIKMKHASDDTMNCTTCHSDENMDELTSITDKTYDFNFSHKLCAQCHQKELKDWAGGAHGKQIGGWVAPRVSLTCVECHNPHTPALEKRWPVRYNTQKVMERQ